MRYTRRTRVRSAFIAMVAAGTAFLAYRAWSSRVAGTGRNARLPDYSGRSGFPAPPGQMRGLASDFEVPPDFRTPEALRPYRQDLH